MSDRTVRVPATGEERETDTECVAFRVHVDRDGKITYLWGKILDFIPGNDDPVFPAGKEAEICAKANKWPSGAKRGLATLLDRIKAEIIAHHDELDAAEEETEEA